MQVRALAFNLAFLLFALAVAELYLSGLGDLLFGKKTCFKIKGGEGSFATGFYDSDQFRGYTAKPLQHARSILDTLGGDVIYDVFYSTDEHGLRLTPPNNNPFAKHILFFGCSFTFGDGVQDNESLPYVFQVDSKNKYKAWNFALSGYGPHQMLRIIESGLIDSVVGQKPDVAIYQGLLEHIERSAGNYPYLLWDINGPKYVLNDRNEAEFRGKFVDSRILNFTLHQVGKSMLIQRILPFVLGHKRTSADIDLFVAILARSRDLLQSNYGTKFVVLLWDDDRDNYLNIVLHKLREKNLNVITTRDISSDLVGEHVLYRLHECDGHPSAKAYKLISNYFLNFLESDHQQ